MFSEAYKKLCIENAEKLRELWEPKFGDWAVEEVTGDLYLIIDGRGGGKYIDFVPFSWEGYEEGQIHTGLTETLIPLPTPRQLMRMLEEREQFFEIRGPFFREDKRYVVDLMDDEFLPVYSPDPETALLRCLMEVMKDD